MPGLGGDFAYLRCRRIAPAQLSDIDHPQVWTALQLTHGGTVLPFDDAPVLFADYEDQRLIYVPHYLAKHNRALAKAVRESTAAIVYTWQPELIRQRLRAEEHVQIEPVPQSLARRFGMRI